MQVSIIVAASENNVIGKSNKLPWHLPEDMRHFKEITMDHVIVMGRKTYESIGKNLPGRKMVVLTRNPEFKPAGVKVFDTIERALNHFREEQELFVIGGAEIFNAAMIHTDKIYLTRVHHEFEGDSYFPELNPIYWKTYLLEKHNADAKNLYDYSFIELVRMR